MRIVGSKVFWRPLKQSRRWKLKWQKVTSWIMWFFQVMFVSLVLQNCTARKHDSIKYPSIKFTCQVRKYNNGQSEFEPPKPPELFEKVWFNWCYCFSRHCPEQGPTQLSWLPSATWGWLKSVGSNDTYINKGPWGSHGVSLTMGFITNLPNDK